MSERRSGWPTLRRSLKEHPGAAARIFKEFAKRTPKFELKGAFEGNKVSIDVLASLPTYNEALAKLMSVEKLPQANWFVPIAAVRDQKNKLPNL